MEQGRDFLFRQFRSIFEETENYIEANYLAFNTLNTDFICAFRRWIFSVYTKKSDSSFSYKHVLSRWF